MSNPTTGIRRSVVEIVAEMLFVCSNSGANKTAIMYRCNLSYAQLQRYLAVLCARKLLTEKEGRFVVTDKGRDFLEQLSNVIAIIRYLKEDESSTDDLTTSLPMENGSFLKVQNNNGAKT
jgi:predicted transcriptional regulator